MLVDWTERWLPIPGYEGLYEVSDWGRVRSWLMRGHGTDLAKTPLIMTTFPEGAGKKYRSVNLRRRGDPQWGTRKFFVQRLILSAFVGPCPDGHEAAHEDGDHAANLLSNLAWKTHQENMDDRARHGRSIRGSASPNTNLTEEQVADARRRRLTPTQAANELGMSWTSASDMLKKRTWKHVA